MYNHHFNQMSRLQKLALCFIHSEMSFTDHVSAMLKLHELKKRNKVLHQMCLSLIDRFGEIDALDILKLEASFVANGPKIYTLTPFTCEALENVEMNFDAQDYRQPFPVIGLDYTREHMEKRFIKNNIFMTVKTKEDKTFQMVPDYALLACMEDPITNLLLGIRLKSFTPVQGFEAAYLKLQIPLKKLKTLEDIIDLPMPESNHRKLNEEEKVFYLSVLRTICNMSMLILDGGQHEFPDNHKERLLARTVKNPKSRKDKFDFRVRPQHYTLKQDIPLLRRQPNIYDKSDNVTGIKVEPHWRSGHWRNQRIGEGRVSVQRRLIPPVFVNKRYFTGDLSNTIVNYRE